MKTNTEQKSNHALENKTLAYEDFRFIPDWMKESNRFAGVDHRDLLEGRSAYCYIDLYTGRSANANEAKTLCSLDFAINAQFQDCIRYFVYMPKAGDDLEAVEAVNSRLYPLDEEPVTDVSIFDIYVYEPREGNVNHPLIHGTYLLGAIQWDMDRKHRYETFAYDAADLADVFNRYCNVDTYTSKDVLGFLGYDVFGKWAKFTGNLIDNPTFMQYRMLKKDSGEENPTVGFEFELLLTTTGWPGKPSSNFPDDKNTPETETVPECSLMDLSEIPSCFVTKNRWVGIRGKINEAPALSADRFAFKRYVDVATGWGVDPKEPQTLHSLKQVVDALNKGMIHGIAYIEDVSKNTLSPSFIKELGFDYPNLTLWKYPTYLEYEGSERHPNVYAALEGEYLTERQQLKAYYKEKAEFELLADDLGLNEPILA